MTTVLYRSNVLNSELAISCSTHRPLMKIISLCKFLADTVRIASKAQAMQDGKAQIQDAADANATRE